jgi:RNA polymerase sigma-70 factor (ECF subfamily)
VTLAAPVAPDRANEARPLVEDDARLLEALLDGDEAAFARLVERYHASFVRLACGYVGDRAVAEEVAQDAWLGILRGLPRFAGRASLKTWMFRILINCAKHRLRRERPTVSLAVFGDGEPFEPAVAADRFRGPGDRWPGGWVAAPPDWGDAPEQRLLSAEVRGQLAAAIDRLPPSQRAVVVLRDVHGLGSAEVCQALHLSEANQRVLLHRGRSKVRQALADYMYDVRTGEEVHRE